VVYIRRNLLEKVARLEHIQWRYWARVRTPDHPLLKKPYSQLSGVDKEKDRVWARKVLSIVLGEIENGARIHGGLTDHLALLHSERCIDIKRIRKILCGTDL